MGDHDRVVPARDRSRVGEDRPAEAAREGEHRLGVGTERPAGEENPGPTGDRGDEPGRRRRARGAVDDDGRATACRPAVRAGSGSGTPTRGSRKARLRWTGPGPVGEAVASTTSREANERHDPIAAPSGTPGSAAWRTDAANSPLWTIVWGAPTPCSSKGGSVDPTINGPRARSASITAAWTSDAGVPLVVTTTTGSPPSSRDPEREERRRALVEAEEGLEAAIGEDRDRERG